MAHLLSDVVEVKLDDSTASFVDISGSVTTVTADGGNASVDDTGLGDARHTEINDIKPIQTLTLALMVNSTSEAIVVPLQQGTSLAKTVSVKFITGQYLGGESRVGTVSNSVPIGLQTASLELRSADVTGFIRTSVAFS